MTEQEIRMLYSEMTDGQREIFEMGMLAERERIINITRVMTKEYVVADNTAGIFFLSDIGGRILRGAKELKDLNYDR
jgi:hypothetical protein